MRERLRAFLLRLIEHPHYKILAVLLALTAWWYVQASEVDERRIRVSVDWIAPPDLVTTEPLPTSVLVTVSGSRNALRRVDEHNVRMTIDLGTEANTLGDHSLDLTAVPVRGLPGTVLTSDVVPSMVSFTLDEVDVRSVTVQPVVVGEPDEGFMVVESRIEPAVIEVRGPRTALASLVTVETEPLDVSGLRHDKRFEARLDLPRAVVAPGVDQVEARIDLEPKVESRVFSEVPIYVRAQTGWRVDPGTVSVRLEGSAAALRQIRERDVVAQVYLPDVPTRLAYSVSFSARDGVRAEVTLASESLRVVDVQPSEVKVVRP